MQRSGFRAQLLGFRVQGLGLRVGGLGKMRVLLWGLYMVYLLFCCFPLLLFVFFFFKQVASYAYDRSAWYF